MGIGKQRSKISDRNSHRNFARQRLSFAFILVLLLMAGPALAWGDQTYSMEAIKLKVSARLPQSMVDALSPAGVRVIGDSDGAKTAICEIFWAARGIAVQESTPGATKLLYGNVKPGTFVGVIHFLITKRYVRDYRTQMLKPGYYTMRYIGMPEAVEAGGFDFVMLSPLSADRTPSQIPPLDELVRRGRLASRTRRPLAMSLVEVDTDQKFPSLITDDEGTCVLQVRLHLKSAKSKKSDTPQEVSLALIVVTSIPEDLGD